MLYGAYKFGFNNVIIIPRFFNTFSSYGLPLTHVYLTDIALLKFKSLSLIGPNPFCLIVI